MRQIEGGRAREVRDRNMAGGQNDRSREGERESGKVRQ